MQIQANNDYDEMEKQKLNEAMDKIAEEEQRYAKAYGTGILESGQFQEVMKDAKKRKLALQRQLEELETRSSQETINVSVEDYLNEAEKYLGQLDFSNKLQVVRDIIGRVIIKERSEVEVWAHIPLQYQLATQKLGHEPIRRNRSYTVPTLEFKFNFKLPEPRKMRDNSQEGRIWQDYQVNSTRRRASNPPRSLFTDFYKIKQIFLGFVGFEATLKVTQAVSDAFGHQTPICAVFSRSYDKIFI